MILYVEMVVAVGLVYVASEFKAPAIPRDVPAVVRNGMAGFACVAGAVALFVRFVLLAKLLSADALGGITTTALGKLRTYYTVCYVLSEAVAITGFALRFLGVGRVEALPFFVGAAVLFVLCYPRVPMELASAVPSPPA
jgi:hypothetical protein